MGCNPNPKPNPNPTFRPDRGREAVLGARHQKTVRTMCSLAECLHEQGRLAAAVSEMSKAAQTAREALGPDEP